jgi:hypothetical protein
MRRWTVGGIAAAMVIAAGVGAARANEPGTAAAAPRIDWSKCEAHQARVECARVRVPLDWDRPDGAKISLKVVRYLASRPEQRIGSLFVNFGGPGVAGAATVRATGKFLDTLGDGRFDVVGWDPRGTGESTHVRCFANDAGVERFWGPDWTIPTTPAQSRRYVGSVGRNGRKSPLTRPVYARAAAAASLRRSYLSRDPVLASHDIDKNRRLAYYDNNHLSERVFVPWSIAPPLFRSFPAACS